MHSAPEDTSREERVKQSKNREPTVTDYAKYVPIGNATKKLEAWRDQGAEIIYLSSHKNSVDVAKDMIVLENGSFQKEK